MAESRGRILVVEDDESLRRVARHNLAEAGYEVLIEPDGSQGLATFEREAPDAVLTDVRMPGLSGTRLLHEILSRSPETPVLVMTGYGTVREAVEAMKRGAAEYFTKPVDWEEVLLVLERSLDHSRLRRENRRLRTAVRERTSFERIVGESAPMLALFDSMHRLLDVDTTVLLEGETGTGKELVAQALHYQGRRAGGPFVPVNCAAIPYDLFESQLFGHEKGAFTGAVEGRAGAFREASGGTLFLDEVGEIPLAVQPKLLRALAERSIQPVGSSRSVDVDVRVIGATNRSLQVAVEEGEFREDLYYRLAVVPLRLPPLRERSGDAVLIARHVLADLGHADAMLSHEAERAISTHAWPGNVRDLRNAMERALVMAEDPDVLGLSDLPDALGHPSSALETLRIGGGFPEEGIDLAELERDCIRRALAAADGNQTRAAALLGITRQTLIYRLDKYDLRAPDGRSDSS